MKKPRRRKATKEKMIRIQVQLPPRYKGALDALRMEGYSASGYLRFLLEKDLEARHEAGWTPWKGR